MHDRGLGRKASQARDQAHPHIRFPFASLSSLAARLSHWGWRAHKRLLERTAQHLAAFRQDSEHRLDIQPSPSLIANLAQTRGFRMMGEIHPGGVLHQQDHRSGFDLFARLLPMRLHQCLKGHILFIEQSIQGHGLFPGLHLGRQRGRGILGHVRRRFHGSPRPTNVLEFARSKGAFGPTFRIQDFFGIHLPILPDC